MKLQKQKLLSQIEILREKLHNSMDKRTNVPKCSFKTHMLSKELDRLIYRYMSIDK